ncbi:hypothetical protein DV711_08505 [Motiliproteus coralliicola]|uniref:Uncharacterized protein n=1 Tax=Motiliproteus coralliicola TaxID=2283196 RepID=A0A369WKM5_9GAMM|nr:hypothetical protein [Motiliproteus coralliicola]RDE22618.1 hypothetical protein DV711_08505 [Motiliproteus coralliicola]
MLNKIIENPYLNLISGLILLITSGYEVSLSFKDPSLGAHHGIFIFSIFQIMKTIPDIMHGLKNIQEADSIVESK